MVDRSPEGAGESSTHILTESESGQWQHALLTAADAFTEYAKSIREAAEGRVGAAKFELEGIAAKFERQAKQAHEAAALLADADRVEIVRTAPEGGVA